MSDLLYEKKDKIATITLNRPDKLNAFTGDMIAAWARSLAEAQADDNVNVVIVTGAGRAFCATCVSPPRARGSRPATCGWAWCPATAIPTSCRGWSGPPKRWSCCGP